ncbi:MAG: 4Fe-4S binding protein [Candidatus Tectomicrobia bacterium]|uniref:4Fe-4S binding protein n=1 Tax=Tectimicrobiota bacterium TaxID=2528274 RepID=A0A932CRA9_UNCTE|nr:4Fe-4S binding protein [Candidatus Tectomicrobia bacterium]
MRCLIVCHSSTGNTRFGVEIIRREMEEAGIDCQIRKVGEVSPGEIGEYDLVGVASPVFGFQPAFHLQEFLQGLPPLPGRLGFAFCSYSFSPANTLATLVEALARKGITPLSAHAMQAEEAFPPFRLPAYIPSQGRPDLQDARGVQQFARQVIRHALEWKEGEREEMGGGVAHTAGFDHLTPFINRDLMRLSMGKWIVSEARCIRCGRCAQVCPIGAIALQPFPVRGKGCIGCWGCFNLCPQGAIESNLAHNRLRYPGMREYQKMRIERALEETI